jgi:hypothetical protein
MTKERKMGKERERGGGRPWKEGEAPGLTSSSITNI